jgi:hypothetical protein
LTWRVENGGSEQIYVCNCDHSSLMERDHKARFTPGVKSMVRRVLRFHDFKVHSHMNCWPRRIEPHIGTMVKTPRVDSVRGGSRTRAFSWGLGTASGAPPSRERTLRGTSLTTTGTYFLVCGLALCGSFDTRGSLWWLDWWMKKISIGKSKNLEPGPGRQG